MKRTFDPILVEVIKNELATVNEEMAIAVYRTGRSAMVKVGDFATAVCDAKGRVVGEGAAPFLEIINAAQTESVDLIVMGTHGRSGLVHVLMGSVAERVVNKAPCAVLTVRHPDRKFKHPLDK